MKTQIKSSLLRITLLAILSFAVFAFKAPIERATTSSELNINVTSHKNVTVNGVNIFYREAGDINKPTILLLQISHI